MSLVDDIVHGVEARDKVAPALASFLPFIKPGTQNETQLAAELAILAATFKGSFEATHYRLADRSKHYFPGWKAPTSNTLRNHIVHINRLNDEIERGYNEAGMNDVFDHVLHAHTEAAIRTRALDPNRSIAVLDGKPLPFYGRSYTYGHARRRHRDEMTPAGQRANPAFRGHKREAGSQPQFAGAENSIDWLNLTRYDPVTQYNGGEMFRRLAPGRSLDAAVRDVMPRLQQRPPWIVMADKEFAYEEMMNRFLRLTAAFGTEVMVARPIRPDTRIASELRRMWTRPEEVHVIPNAERGYAFWGLTEFDWASGHSKYPLLAIYRTAPPKDESFAPSRLDLHLTVDGRKLPVFVYAFMATFDREFIHQNAPMVERVFSRRWSGENVNKKTARHGAHSPSKRFLPRHLTYGMSLLMQDLWHIWRCKEERAEPKRRWHPSRTFALYRGDLRDALLPYALSPPREA